MEVTSVTGRLLRRGSVSPLSVSDLLDLKVLLVSRDVMELLGLRDCLAVEACPAFLGRTATRGSRAAMERTDCRELEECLGRMDWTESKDQLELRDCLDLRGHLELLGREEGLETREMPDRLEL